MKALHIINGEFYAGAERVQDLLALRLPDFGVDLEFFCLKPGAFVEKRTSSAPLTAVEMRSKWDMSAAERISAAAKGKAFDLIHTHSPRSALIGQAVARSLGLPLIHHVHSPARRDTESRVRNWINGTIEERLVIPKATKLIAVSQSLRHYLEERGFSGNRVEVIPNGVPVAHEDSRWAPPANEWLIGAAALFRPRKGVDVLLKALSLLRDSGASVRLKLIGSFETPAYEQEIRNLATQLKISSYIDWHGFTADVPKEMKGLSIFALPSLYGEGMPMVLLEAMSIGLPVVASDIEGVPEVLQGDTGVLVPPGNEHALADAIRSLIASPLGAVEMAALSLRRHREKYSDTAMAAAVSALYERVLREG